MRLAKLSFRRDASRYLDRFDAFRLVGVRLCRVPKQRTTSPSPKLVITRVRFYDAASCAK